MVANDNTRGLHPSLPNAARLTGAAAQGPIHPDSREAGNLLEALDDAMFAAIAGDAEMLPLARDLWAAAAKSLPAEIVGESREQYLRYAVDMTRKTDADEVRDPAKAVVAMEILELLTKGC